MKVVGILVLKNTHYAKSPSSDSEREGSPSTKTMLTSGQMAVDRSLQILAAY